jgi:DNA-binding IclR family transcriptional regulator
MPPKARNLVLTKSQAACLAALQHRKGSKAEIAILAKLDLLKTAAALRIARHCRPAGVEEHITRKWIASEAGRSRVWPSDVA